MSPPQQLPHRPPSRHVGPFSPSPCPPRSLPPLSRPRLRTPLRLCGAPPILLAVFRIRRLLLSSSGPITSAILYLLSKASIPVSCATSPGLGGGCCFPCRGSCPCAPSGAVSLAREEVPHARASPLSSRDGDPAPSLAQLFYSPRVPSLRSFDVGVRYHYRVRLLGHLTETGLALHGLDARSHRRAQSPHPLAGAAGIALLRYRPHPRPLPW